MDATLLLPIMDRVALLAAPSAVHAQVWSVDAATDLWARQTGLVTGDADSSPLGRAAFGRLAARIFPHAPVERVELFSRWLTWIFAFDDARDEGRLGASATAVDALYGGLLMGIKRGHARPESGALEIGLTELWRDTGQIMSQRWRQRFLAHLEDHRRGCLEEAVHRRTRHIPPVGAYPAIRRRSAGLFAYDLADLVLGYEIPTAVLRAPAWLSIQCAVADIVSWSNDVVSLERESSPHNYLKVFAHTYGLDPELAATWVTTRIAERVPELEAAARQLPATYLRLELDPETVRRVGEAADTLLAVPRAHLEWLQETGRYDAPAVPHTNRKEPLRGLTGSASLSRPPHGPPPRSISSRSPSPTGP